MSYFSGYRNLKLEEKISTIKTEAKLGTLYDIYVLLKDVLYNNIRCSNSESFFGQAHVRYPNCFENHRPPFDRQSKRNEGGSGAEGRVRDCPGLSGTWPGLSGTVRDCPGQAVWPQTPLRTKADGPVHNGRKITTNAFPILPRNLILEPTNKSNCTS